MIKHQKLKYYLLIIFQITPVYLEATSSCTEWVAKVVSVQGKVETQRFGIVNWKAIKQGDVFCQGDKIRSEKNSRATLQLSNNSLISVDQNTNLNFSVPKVEAASSWLIELFKGSAFFRSRESQRLNINTPFINAVHEGTEFLVTVNSEQTEITVFDGQVAATNQQGKINIKKGFTGIAKQGEAPRVKALTIRPEDAVQWTLYYPPIIDYQHFKSAVFKPAIDAYERGHTYQSLDILEDIPTDQQDGNYLVLKSSMLLTVGRVEEALQLIKQARSLNQDESGAIALQSVVAVTKNRQDEALNLAQQAVTLNPQSAIAQIALSYAYQSNFKIEPALQAAKEATRLSPDNALAWARLSELQLSTGERSDALESAKKAQVLNPQLDRTHTILGFANLAKVDIDEAKSAFNKAIKLNSADPLARLGLGLAKIRKGDVEEGTLDLETAVSLDPDNAIMRSYLGKAYYELKNDGFAGTELAIAKEMDANDPTPWFYDAIRKQTTNRPVEALHDMQKAIELNDNRGVYRSKLLLDEDLAARSASLGRIYNDLGFQQRGLLEGWKSVNVNPSNYSAHRLLADNYAALPRHEIARVSELLQSQLLQPVNITPVQPQLAESNLLVLNGLGSQSTSFNEFNPLFTRNRFAMQASGLYGSNNTWSDEVTHSGLWDQFSYSLGQHHYETDGFRENNNLKQDIYNGFFQFNLSPKLNMQAELRYSDTESGDLPLRFDPLNFSKSLKKQKTTESVRIGSRYNINTSSNLLFSFIRNEVNETTNDLNLSNFFRENIDLTGYTTEIQYLYDQNKYSLILGGGYANINTKSNTFQFGQSNQSIENSDHADIYLYLKGQLFKELEAILGVSYNKTEDLLPFGVPLTKSQINPKFGLIWTPLNDLTIRGAAFRMLKRNLATNVTIEPTNVAGFNQFFDDKNASDVWRYGVAADYKISPTILSGITLSKRELNVPFSFADFTSMDSQPILDYSDWTEENLHGYLYWTPHNQIAVSLEHSYEKFKRSEKDPGVELLKELNTHRTSLGFNFFDYSGFFVKVKGTYFDQNGLFVDRLQRIEKRGSDNFWLVDGAIGFRFPKRFGIFSLNINNVFNESFNYQDTDPTNPTIYSDRTIFGRINLSF